MTGILSRKYNPCPLECQAFGKKYQEVKKVHKKS